MNANRRRMTFETAFYIWSAATASVIYSFSLIASLTFAK